MPISCSRVVGVCVCVCLLGGGGGGGEGGLTSNVKKKRRNRHQNCKLLKVSEFHFFINYTTNFLRPKQLSMAATARVIWLCACVRYWPYRGAVLCYPCSLKCFFVCLFVYKKQCAYTCLSSQRLLVGIFKGELILEGLSKMGWALKLFSMRSFRLLGIRVKTPGARFSKVLKSFRPRKPITKISQKPYVYRAVLLT